jgi:Ser/Thr protein kinase RdoA (MazF antagonist)
VVAARATRTGWGLRLELATARVNGARDLYVALRAGAEAVGLASTAGRSVARLHQAGLRHRDLTVENLLVGSDPDAPLTVIDLDRCSLKGAPLSRSERVAALARLARSAVKRGLMRPDGPLDADTCAGFLAAYTAARGQPEPNLGRAVASRVRRHRSLWGRARSMPGAG